MDYLFSFPILLLSLFLCLLVPLYKLKTNHSKPSLRFPPGPCPFPIIGNVHNIFGSLPHRAMRDLSRQYGPLMLLHLGEAPTVIVSSPDAAREIMKTYDVIFASRPINTTMGIMGFGGKGIFFSPCGEYWRQIRKICVLELLSTKRVQSYRSIREEEVTNLINYISSCASHSKPVNLSKRLTLLINNIITRAIIGSKCKNQDVFLHELDTTVQLAAGFNLIDFFPSSRLARLISSAANKAERCHQAKIRFLDDVIEEHRQRKITTGESEVEDLLGVLLRLHDEDNPGSHLDMECWDEFGYLAIRSTTQPDSMIPERSDLCFFFRKYHSQDLFGAGTDTSATTLEWAMSELLRNPTAFRKAQSEVCELLKGNTQVSESDLDKLNYLHLVIKETLRLHPPVPFLLPRQCRETCRIFDYDIAEGMTVLVNTWAIGRDPKYWENPEEFKPERFANSRIDFRGADFELIPFGSGRRMCTGMSFGLVNVELPLASLLYHFDWKLPDELEPEQIDRTESHGITIRRKTPLLFDAVPHETSIGIHG